MNRPRLAWILAVSVSSFIVSSTSAALARGGDADRAGERAPRLDGAGNDGALPFNASDVIASASRADDSSDDSSVRDAHPKDRSKALVMRATDAALAGRWIEAEALFRDAWAIEKTYDIAGNLGHIELQNKKPLEAARHLRFSLEALPPSESSELRQRVEARYDEARKQIGSLVIKTSEPGADVSVDGVSVGAAPLETEVLVEAGSHSVRATRVGFDVADQTVRVEEGGSKGVTLTLLPSVELVASPSSTSASAIFGAPAADAKRSSSLYTGIAVSSGAFAVTSLALGAGFHVAAQSQTSDADGMRASLDRKNGPAACYDDPTLASECAALRSATNSGAAMSIGSKVAFGLGGVAAAGSIVYLILGRSSHDPKKGTTVLPSVTANAGGLLISSVW